MLGKVVSLGQQRRSGRHDANRASAPVWGRRALYQFIPALAILLTTIAARAEDTDFCDLGLYATQAGNYDLAIDDYDSCLREGHLSPENQAVLLNNRGYVYAALGEYDRAIADLDDAIRLEPDYAKAFHKRGRAYAGKGAYDRAIADYGAAIRLKPDYAEAYCNRGYAYANKGQYRRAIADFDAAIRLKPGYAFAFKARGIARSNVGD